MIQPREMKLSFPMSVANGVLSTTDKVWNVLVASRDGDLKKLENLINECYELIYAQYNYTPAIHFAVREGNAEMVNYLLERGALDPTYITYPFNDSLLTVAQDRGHHAIADLLRDYLDHPGRCKFKGDNGEIHYGKPKEQMDFQEAINKGQLDLVKKTLEEHPEWLHDETIFWSEGILMMPAHDNNIELLELLMSHGARVPLNSKWGRFYYFNHYEAAAFLLNHGMDPNHHTWHHVTLLHDMAQSGDLKKATLLLDHGADLNTIEEEYLSTPLGLAARWGHTEMVELLLGHGADPQEAGADWAKPLAWARAKGHGDIIEVLEKRIEEAR